MAGKLRITQYRSVNGANPRQRDTLRTLGLGRIGRTVERPDEPATPPAESDDEDSHHRQRDGKDVVMVGNDFLLKEDEVAADVVELYEPLAEEKKVGLSLMPSMPAVIEGNRSLIAQAERIDFQLCRHRDADKIIG